MPKVTKEETIRDLVQWIANGGPLAQALRDAYEAGQKDGSRPSLPFPIVSVRTDTGPQFSSHGESLGRPIEYTIEIADGTELRGKIRR